MTHHETGLPPRIAGSLARLLSLKFASSNVRGLKGCTRSLFVGCVESPKTHRDRAGRKWCVFEDLTHPTIVKEPSHTL